MDWVDSERINSGSECIIVGGESPITKEEASIMLTSETDAKIVHFGSSIKGGGKFPQYFIPLYFPKEDKSLSFFKRWLMQRSFDRFVTRAAQTICLNDWIYTNVPKTKACLPLATLPQFEWTALAATKDVLSGGNPYFLAFVSLEELKSMLKEFSIFKKWQQTNMSIVFVMETQSQVNQALSLLKGYKFNEAVFIVHQNTFKLEWMAAAYISLWSHNSMYHSCMLEWSVKWGIPVLINSTNKLPESWHKAGEVFDFAQKMALSNHFKLYYKDEVYRQARANMGTAWLTTINSTFVS